MNDNLTPAPLTDEYEEKVRALLDAGLVSAQSAWGLDMSAPNAMANRLSWLMQTVMVVATEDASTPAEQTGVLHGIGFGLGAHLGRCITANVPEALRAEAFCVFLQDIIRGVQRGAEMGMKAEASQ
jgi:hypothetical protein